MPECRISFQKYIIIFMPKSYKCNNIEIRLGEQITIFMLKKDGELLLKWD